MAGNQIDSWRLRAGSYLGEISALALLHSPPCCSSSLPLLLAGTGSEILVYDIGTGDLLNSFHVFDGIRVHGIAGNGGCPASRIAVYGEKRAKMFLISVRAGSEEAVTEGGKPVVDFELECGLPRFNHWVLDALFIEGDSYVVLGLCDNSLAVWDIAKESFVLRLQSPDRCLLYSLRLWGGNLESLRVASGTIYNEIIIWKICRDDSGGSSVHSDHNDVCLLGQQYIMSHLSTLCGHEGSIFRLAWSHDGSRLVSVSDDRSARVWIHSALRGNHYVSDNHDVSSVVLYGHDARIWDCYISDTIIVTVGEDCSCRLWGIDGKQLAIIKEHIGRGIWRCLYDPVAEILITAGFDSAIKIHQLQLSSFKGLGSVRQNGVLTDFGERTEVFFTCNPYASKLSDKMDSKSEYIRCLLFTKEDALYVATNNGYLYYITLTTSSSIEWTQIAHVSKEAPLICMDLLSNSCIDSVEADDVIAIGDGKGNATVLRVVSSLPGVCKPKVAFSFMWSAEVERQLLGIFWCSSLGYTHLFTADPRGTIKVWGLEDALSSQTDHSEIKTEIPLISVFTSFFGARIMCLDVSFQDELLVCGDQRGNLSVFSFPRITTVLISNERVKVPLITQFKGAHGISSVSSVSIGNSSPIEVEICTAGGDGCICYFKFIKSSKILEFIGMKQVKELSTVKSVVGSSYFCHDQTQGKYAVGFTSTDFIVCNLVDEIKILRVSCGGWRRPYSFYIGVIPEIQNCFAFLKENIIHIHRLWIPSNERKSFSKVLHTQFHGREIHSLKFIPIGLHGHLIATGCEDGTVRLTRYVHSDINTWMSSRPLGEHVGGSAVRSLCFVSIAHTSRAGQSPERHLSQVSSNGICDWSFLISVGAKQVLTAWLLEKSTVAVEDAFTGIVNGENKPNISKEFPSMIFRWLSSHMPSKHCTKHNVPRNLVKPFQNTNVSTSCSARMTSESELVTVPNHENDWRYLAVTAFLVKVADIRCTVCFIVVSGSDATLTMRALLLPQRLWFDVAFLVPQDSPVLVLQHVVSPVCHDHKGEGQDRHAYIIISGSTDGTITFWDVSKSVENFLECLLESQPTKFANCPSRPQTGRGSQGGRWWKSTCSPQNRIGNFGNVTTRTPSFELGASVTSSESANKSTILPNSMDINTSSLAAEIYEVQPLLVLDSVHQSGVNCLHASKMKISDPLEPEFIYCILSGGDDQSVHCTVVTLKQQMSNPSSTGTIVHTQESRYLRKCSYSKERNQHSLTVLYKHSIASAHSSAVKGIWTDGEWAFSTGLDQRIRCWHISACGKLAEHGRLIISVPEPETLDAIPCSRNRYQIAVAGRGMQMVTFANTSKDPKIWS